jgi:dienelactone hydrolase
VYRWLVAKTLYGLLPFVLYYNRPTAKYPIIQKFMDDFRCSEGASLKVGAVGFCWGGYQVTQLAQGALAKNGKPLVDAVFTAHPSALSVPGDIEKIKQPYSVAIGDGDFALPIKGVKQMQEVLEGMQDVESEVVILPGAKHGFAVRGNPEDKKEKEQADQAEDQCVRWFEKYLV